MCVTRNIAWYSEIDGDLAAGNVTVGLAATVHYTDDIEVHEQRARRGGLSESGRRNVSGGGRPIEEGLRIMQKRMSRWVAIWGAMAILAASGWARAQAPEPLAEKAIEALFVDGDSANSTDDASEGLKPATSVAPARAIELARRQAAREGKLVRRHRAVRARALNLQSTQAVSIALFDGEVVTARRERFDRHDNRNVWWGQVDGKDFSSVRLTDRKGVLSGAVTWAGHTYWLKHAGEGTYALEEIEQAAFLPCGGTRPASDTPSSSVSSAPVAQVSATRVVSNDGTVSTASSAGVPSTDDGTVATVDLLAVYTAAAGNGAGGVNALLAQIEDAVDQSNYVYSNSGVHIHLNLVGTYYAAYTETGSSDDDLDHLDDGDGDLGMAHRLRDLYGADLVTLIVEDFASEPQVGGRAKCGPGADNAFSVVKRNQIGEGAWALTHELGHNMGADHDRANIQGQQCGHNDYAYGFRMPGAVKTIMAYPCNLNCDGCAPCDWVGFFSNPYQLLWVAKLGTNIHIGDDVTDNVRELNETRWTVAANRPSVPPPTAPVLAAPLGDVATGTPAYYWLPSQNAYSYSLSVLRNGASFLAVTLPAQETAPGWNCRGTVCYYTPNVVHSDDSYTWTVVVSNIVGATASSAVGSFRVVTTGPDSADYVGDTIPGTMAPGQQYGVSVTMRNTGTATWSENEMYRLGAVGNSDPFYPSARVMLPANVSVPPGQTYTFTFTMAAPTTTGTYSTNWRMVHENVDWFGATLARQIAIAFPPPNGDSWPWPSGDGNCLADAFSYGNGDLNGQGGWSGDAGAEIQVVSRTVQTSGGPNAYGATRTLPVPCGPDGSGIITVQANVAKGYGAGNTWNLWIDDPNGRNLARWYGPPSAARGRITSGNLDVATPASHNLTDTAIWDALKVRIDTRAGESEFFFNGTSLGTLSFASLGADGRVGSVTLERRDNYQAAGNYLYFDNLAIGGVPSSAPVPVPTPNPTPNPTPTPFPPPTSGPREAVVWTNAVGVSVSGNNLTKTAASGSWNAGAVSTRAIASGDGYVECVASETTTSRMVGLSNGDSNQSYTDIDFAIHLAADDTVRVSEGGTNKYIGGAYSAGDVFRVSVESGVAKYYKNGTVFYASTVTPTYPLLVDTALADQGSTIHGVVISGNLIDNSFPPPPPREAVVWTNAVGVSVSGNNLTKTAASGWGNAGAVSTRAIASGDGYVECVASETTTSRMVGLSNGDSNQSYTDIDFAAYLVGGTLMVYEGGVPRGSFGSFATGDVIRVSVVGGVVRYSKNGTVFYTSTVTPTYPLLVDTALLEQGGTIQNVVISGSLTGS
jgi:hypothetical protein